MMYKTTPESFLNDVKNHQVKILHDADGMRHIRFKQPNTSDMHFDLITWHNHLCYTGDMGTFVFERTPDMFTFFRSEPDRPLNINPHYWAEKLQAVDRCDGYEEFDYELFKKRVIYYLDEYEADAEVRGQVESEILDGETSEYYCVSAINNFSHDEFNFDDFWESDLKSYTGRYIWCCYAITWAIGQYDLFKAGDI